MPTASKQYAADVKYLVGRPFALSTVTWHGTDTVGKVLMNIQFPHVLSLIPQIANVMRYYAYIRPDIEIIIKINGTPMHYGKVLVTYGFPTPLPTGFDADNHYARYNLNWLQMSANSVRSANLLLPYNGIHERIPLNLFYDSSFNTTSYLYNYAELNITVAVPLLVNGDGTSGITISTFLVVKDPGFSGLGCGYAYIPTRKFNTEMFGLSTGLAVAAEAVEAAQSGILLSDITNDLGNWFAKFRNIPFIGVPARLARTITHTSSKVLKLLGFDVPIDVEKSRPVWFRTPKLLQFEDVEQTVPLAPHPNPYVSKDISFLGADQHDYDITKYCSHMMLLSTFKMSSEDPAGALLYYTNLTPCALRHSFFNGTLPEEYTIPTRMAYVARMAEYWRGSMKFHVSVCASRFHSGRIRITWIPTEIASTIHAIVTPTSPTVSDRYLSSFPSIILDINGDTDASFVVPYHQPYEWAATTYYTGNQEYIPYMMDTNGVLMISVVNALVSNDTTTPPGIFIQVFVGAGPDFQIGQPSIADTVAVTRHVSNTPTRIFNTQMSDEFSSDALALKKFDPIIAYNSSTVNENTYLSTNLRSLKQFLNMGGLCYTFRPTATGWYTINTVLTWDTNSWAYAIPSDGNTTLVYEHANAHSYSMPILPLKAYCRGAYRLKYVYADTSSLVKSNAYTTVEYNSEGGYYGPPGASWVNSHASEAVIPFSDLYSSYGVHVFKPDFDSSVVVDIPYYSQLRANPFVGMNTLGTSVTHVTPSAHVTFTRQLAAGSTIFVYLSCGDDFQFAYDTPMPMLAIPHPTPTSSEEQQINSNQGNHRRPLERSRPSKAFALESLSK